MYVIKNCLITDSDAKVLREYCVDKSNPLYQKYKGFNTSLDLAANNVYSMYSGYVSMISGDKISGYDVVISMNKNQAIRYGNLKSTTVKQKESVDISKQLGVANKYVKIEYLSTYIQNNFSFRLNSTLMYKDNPTKLFESESTIVDKSLQFSESGLMDFMDDYDGGIDYVASFILSNNK